jgi:predicted phage tail component-like protein
MFTFNGIASTTYLIENNVHHSILPPLAFRSLAVPGRAGVYDFGVELGPREIAIDVTVKSSSQADLRSKVRAIASWLYQADLAPLVFSDEPDKTYYARLSGSTDLEQIVELGRGTLTFVCPDPYAEGASRSETITSGATVTNNGSVNTFPVVTVMFSGTVGYFKLFKGTQQVYIDCPFTASDVLVLDFRAAKATLNGSKIMDKIDLSSVFFPLDMGETVLTFDPAANATVQVDFKERWL